MKTRKTRKTGSGTSPNSWGHRPKGRRSKTMSFRVDEEFYNLNHVAIQAEIKERNRKFIGDIKIIRLFLSDHTNEDQTAKEVAAFLTRTSSNCFEVEIGSIKNITPGNVGFWSITSVEPNDWGSFDVTLFKV